MKEKLKNYGLWVSITSCILMVLQACGLKFDMPVINEIITAVLGVLVTLGIISNPKEGAGYIDTAVSGDIDNMDKDMTDSAAGDDSSSC